jgi:acetolactate synthase regulatory subunit
VFVFEIEAADIYSVLGRVLDRSRVTGLRLSAVSATESHDGGCLVTATVDTTDRDIVDRLARQFGEMFGVTSVNVERAAIHRPSQSGRTSIAPRAHRILGNA